MTLVNADTGELVGRSLDECESVIDRGLGTFVEVGEALMEIRDARLYRSTHSDFDTYCRERWGFDRRRASALMIAAEVSEISDTPIRTESQARALAPLRHDPAAMAEVMDEVHADAEATGGRVTAERITEKVTERLTPDAVITPQEQRDQDLADSDQRALRRLRMGMDGWSQLVGFADYGRRGQVLALLTTSERDRLATIEEHLHG